ncbi:MAG TPA: DUF1553 domain-containing protein [Pirellulales bacterium]|nr:DUF1553 domain-containing protein [Pirellulales bacterium]
MADRLGRRLGGVLAAWLLLAPGAALAADEDLFRERVAPIFEKHCLRCHGQKVEGGLSLLSAEKLAAGGDSGPAVEPGKPDDSLLIEMVSGEKPEMPKGGKRLAEEEIAVLRQWIAAGARWPQDFSFDLAKPWWSLAPLKRSPIPAVKNAAWPRTPVDAFILKSLEDKNLAPSAEADRRTLIRRLTFDLHGLPPTPEEIDAFEQDASPRAYEDLVDRLLASPRYGERWGRHWLDVVHFGESHGYDKDKPRENAWPYRDYVISALNADTPYGRFIEEQLAGDVLFPERPQAIAATGFISAGPWDFVGHVELREGTVDKDIARSNDRDDMVANAASTFLSLTVHCARCHDHKFDPITQADYYRLQAVFAGVDRADRPYDPDPQLAARRRELAEKKKSLEARQKELSDSLARVTSPEIASIDAKVEERQKQVAAVREPPQPSGTLGYHSQIVPTPDATKWVQVDLGRAITIDQVILVPAHVVYGGHPGPGFGFPPRFKVDLSNDPTFAAADCLADETRADYPHPGDTPYAIDAAGKSGRYIRVTATKLWKRTDDWIFALSELLALSAGRNVAAGAVVTSLDSIEAPPNWAMKNFVDGGGSQQKLLDADGNLTERQRLALELGRLAARRHKLALAALDAAVGSQLNEIARQLSEVESGRAALPPQEMVYAAASEFPANGSFKPAQKPRPVYLLARGDVRSPKELMQPGAVACVSGPSAEFALSDPDNEGQRRAALARWLSDPSNVLVRRSIVNRVWQYHFGQGLVDSPSDFGRMGGLPSHPDLLEWLSRWFMDHGESLKSLHRLLLTSAVYRQSSADNAEFAKFDSGNRLLWRMNRLRLDAECIRDSMLYVAGQLDERMGGPSAKQFYFKDDHSPVYDYERFDFDSPLAARRSVYRFIVRSVPDPFMESLDCADPSILTPKRNVTLTSLQALALLNNTFCVKQAEHLAERVGRQAAGAAEQIEAAYLLALGRRPTAEESALLAGYAQKFGLANACRLIFNSNEFMFID